MLMRFGKDEKTKLISQVPLFANCSKGELQEIAAIADEIDIAEGKELTTEGSPGREFFVIIEGTASVAQDGDQINDLGPGDFFGEMTLIEMQNRSATVVAETPTVLYELTAGKLYSCYKADIHAYVMVMQNINRELCRRLRRADNRIAELETLRAGQ